MKISILLYLLINLLFIGYVYSDETTKCINLRDNFSNSLSLFTSCAINNSRPIKLCESCVNYYVDVLQSYNNMSNLTQNGIVCIDLFINLDRLQIFQTLYHNSLDLWNKAKCYECYEFVNNTLVPILTEETKTFIYFHNNLMECINGTDLNDSTLCPTCMDKYLILNDYYKSISNENEKIGVCMDIVDVMNNTWIFWSNKCCKYRQHSEIIFIISAIIVLLLTILFYVCVNIYTEKKSPAILQQRRFAESLSTNN